MTTSIAAPNRKPVTTARDRNCESHPIRNTARTTKSKPLGSVIPATTLATSAVSVTRAAMTAPPATAASPELGTHRDLPTASEQRVEDRPSGGGVQPVLKRHTSDPGIPQ